MRELLQRADERAETILASRRDDLERLAGVLLERETIEGTDLLELLERESHVDVLEAVN